MPTLLYIHGFLSSPRSLKAQQMGAWLAENHPRYQYLCPLLTPYPEHARTILEQLIENNISDSIYLMGSSLGGFWATWLAEKYDLKAVLINPVVNLDLFNSSYLNVKLKNYHSDDTYMLNESHIAGFKTVNVAELSRPENYLLLVQTMDEVLDYRLAISKYSGSRQIVIDGGDHTFRNFEKYIPAAMQFLEADT